MTTPNRFMFRAWNGYRMLGPVYVSNVQGMVSTDGADVDVIMQSTGLLDSRGVEIFEGDIVERWWLSEKHKRRLVVMYVGCEFICVEPSCIDHAKKMQYQNGRGSGNIWFHTPDCTTSSPNSTVVVIGNIYEHPELL